MSRLLMSLLALSFSTTAAASDGAGTTHGTADVLEQGDWEIGLYAALRRGMGDGVELSIHPITAFFSPHIGVKKAWMSNDNWRLATRHSLIFPTRMLKALAREGTGGILVADATIPTVIVSDNRVIVSTDIAPGATLSILGRLMLGAELGESAWPSIDMPIAYPRTAAYQDNVTAAIGAQLDTNLWGPIGFRWNMNLWAMPFSDGTWALEAKATLPWRPSESFTAQLSSTATMGQYPYGMDWHVLPGFDLIWAW